MIHEFDVGSLRRRLEIDRISYFRAGRTDEIDDIVIDHDGGHHDVGAPFAGAVREKRRVDQRTPFDLVNALGSDVFRKLFDD